MPVILITDTLFIFPEHEAKLREAGFEIKRFPKPEATEDELVEQVKGVDAYILGGTEKVTERVVEAADKLKVIAFTGTDWSHFIPAHKLAFQRGIKITSAPKSSTFAVAELTVTLLLIMLRRPHEFISSLGGNVESVTTQDVTDVKIGILGLGRIGAQVARMLKGIGATQVYYWNRTRKPELEAELGIQYLPLEELCRQCDVITNHESTEAGQIMGANQLAQTQADAVFINAAALITFDMDALYDRIMHHNARAAFDISGGIHDERFTALSPSQWLSTNNGIGHSTQGVIKACSDDVTNSVTNVLTTGTDEFVVSTS